MRMDLILGVVFLITLMVFVHLFSKRVLPERCHHLHLVHDDYGNECLVLDAHVSGKKCLFLVDTAYAGAPVLSTSYLHALANDKWINRGCVSKRFIRTIQTLTHHQSTDSELHEGFTHFMQNTSCRSFTAGCTLRLMGIGSTSETHANMLLCPPAKFKGMHLFKGWDADIFVTNPLPGSIHILTSDYLLHHAPCLIETRRGRLSLRVNPSIGREFDVFDLRLEAGAVLIPIKVGARILNIVVDTGASAPLSLSRSIELSDCRSTERTIQQSGVNGEIVCSDIVSANVTVGSHEFLNVDVLLNSHTVDGADGYMGMGLLRCFDLYFDHRCVGLRRNGLSVRNIKNATQGGCGIRRKTCKA